MRQKRSLDFGSAGEQLIVRWLESQNFHILACNQRAVFGDSQKGEVDIIAVKNSIVHLIEVKTRATDMFGHPEEWVDAKKMQRIVHVWYAVKKRHFPSFSACVFQCDVAAVVWPAHEKPRITIYWNAHIQ